MSPSHPPSPRHPAVRRVLAATAVSAAVATALSLGSLPHEPARAASTGGVVLTSGTIRAPSGLPVGAGEVHALALEWVTGRGQVSHPLATTPVGPDGRFEVTVPQDRLTRWKDDDDGLQVELVVDTPEGGMVWDIPVSDVTPPAGTDPSRRLLREDPDLAGIDLTLGRGETTAEGAIALGTRKRAAARSAPSRVLLRQPAYITECLSQGGTFEWSVPPHVRTRIRWLPIQLMVTRGRSIARVTYQSDLSSAFGVVITASGEGVSAGLSRTANTTRDYEAGAEQVLNRTRAAKVDIRYGRMRGYCFIGSDDDSSYWTNAYKWAPWRWRGGVRKLATNKLWACQKEYTTSSHFVKVLRHRSTRFTRVGTIGAGPLGVRVESETTKGERVGLRLTAKKAGAEFPYCGYRNDPTESYRIREKT